MKQIKKLASILIALPLLSLSFATLFFGATAEAATAVCYQGPLGAVVKLGSCPAPQTDPSRGMVTYSDSGPKTTSPTTCYGSAGSQELPGGTRRTFAPASCADLEGLATQYVQNRCTASGGQWVSVPASSTNEFTAGFACKCTSPQQYRNSICQDPTPTATNPATTDSPKVTSSKCDPESPESATNKCCLATDLNSDNCGIVGYLNLAFNFVSGGVTLAIIGNIIFAGIQYSTAQGDPSAVGKSKKRIRDAIAAFLMFLSLYAFMQWLIPGGVF